LNLDDPVLDKNERDKEEKERKKGRKTVLVV
jgi:hypothetical protein